MLLGGLHMRRLLSVDDVAALSKLPPADECYQALAGVVSATDLKISLLRAMQAPSGGMPLVQYAQSPSQNLVQLLHRWHQMREDGE